MSAHICSQHRTRLVTFLDFFFPVRFLPTNTRYLSARDYGPWKETISKAHFPSRCGETRLPARLHTGTGATRLLHYDYSVRLKRTRQALAV